MKAMAYGAFCYAIFLGTFLYAVGFIGGLAVPKTLDSGPAGPVGLAIAVNGLLLTLFAAQHSVMARPAFKRWWTRFVPQPYERATYVLFSSLALIVLFWAWRPIGGFVWQLSDPVARTALVGLYFAGVGTVLYSTCLIDHFDLFGLRQVVLHFRGEPYSERAFQTPSLYRFIRHPLYVGWFLTVWMTPEMSFGHLLFAVGCTGYILAAIPLEERDLGEALGEPYAVWREQTPFFVPSFRGNRSAREPASARP